MTRGKIMLVGFGPGSEAHMTHRAKAAIAEAEVVVGYKTYIKLVADLLDGKEVVEKGMTEEIDRCYEAYDQALAGKVVALVSSGDIGVYGMAGPFYEALRERGWKPGDGVDVEVVPGCTALTACASLVGAPLTHDFCSISLSDLLTPWPVIAKRIDAAGRGDFVVALYNPKSGRRTGQIVEAQKILLRHRAPTTPVAVVKSAYRKREVIQLTTLAAMSDCDIGMLTTVLVGNNSTFAWEGLMITPRGYAKKYDYATGQAHEGETAGVSLSMGLEGWKELARQWMTDHPNATIEEAATEFDAPVGEILDALGRAKVTVDAMVATLNEEASITVTLPGRGGLSMVETIDGASLRVDGDALRIGARVALPLAGIGVVSEGYYLLDAAGALIAHLTRHA